MAMNSKVNHSRSQTANELYANFDKKFETDI